MLPTPPDWSDDEVAICTALHGCGTHSLTIPYEATPHRLISAGWLTMWPGLMLVTFTPGGAHALGLTLDGEPARWCDKDEVRALRSARGGKSKTAGNATDAGVDLDAKPSPYVEPDTIVLMGGGRGWHGLLGLPLHEAMKHETWGECEVCHGVKLPKGTDCARCNQKPVHGVAYKAERKAS